MSLLPAAMTTTIKQGTDGLLVIHGSNLKVCGMCVKVIPALLWLSIFLHTVRRGDTTSREAQGEMPQPT